MAKRSATLWAALFIAACVGTAAAATNEPLQVSNEPLRGEVLEVKDAPPYTYLRLKTKNGEMWAAAMLASAPFVKNAREAIKAGLEEIPEKSRLTEAIHDVIGWCDEGIDFEAAIRRVHERWDETWGHHWCHTISNAQIVAIGLLWGEEDFEKSICRAVQACFDTDCNGATVGSEHDVWVEDREKRIEVAAARGGEKSVDNSSLAGEIRVGSRGRFLHPAACPARELPCRSRGAP
jgi:hypothetical protein